jgi:FlaA1/EpsC-like NDP-sugar epimerase
MLLVKKIYRVVSWLITDIVFVNMAFYSAYLIRFNGVIEMPSFIPYLHLWPHISVAHLIIFSIFRFYVHSRRFSKKEIFINTFNACTISALASISIVYVMRHLWGFIPSLVFVFAWGFNIILAGGWRVFVRYEPAS